MPWACLPCPLVFSSRPFSPGSWPDHVLSCHHETCFMDVLSLLIEGEKIFVIARREDATSAVLSSENETSNSAFLFTKKRMMFHRHTMEQYDDKSSKSRSNNKTGCCRVQETPHPRGVMWFKDTTTATTNNGTKFYLWTRHTTSHNRHNSRERNPKQRTTGRLVRGRTRERGARKMEWRHFGTRTEV